MQHKIGDRALGRWKEILPALGMPAGLLTGKHGPCPVCNGKDRFRFDNKAGKGTWYCNQGHGGVNDKDQGSSGNGFALIMDWKGCDFAEAARLVEQVIGKTGEPVGRAEDEVSEAEATAKALAEAKAVWASGRKVTQCDPVDLYLKNRVGKYAFTRAIRYLPETYFAGRTMPAMLSAYVDVHGDLYGVQRTFLTADGQKAGVQPDRWNHGRLPDGGAVRLTRPDPVLAHSQALGIAEGVETALAATALYGIPCWAALNAGRLKVWEPPEHVTEVVIFGDNDIKHDGQASAYALAQRLSTRQKRPITTQVMIPADIGTDWNDVLQLQLRSAQ